jgi:hypothetical protein
MGANSDSHEDDFQSTVYNAPSSIDAIIPRSSKAHMTRECTISEEIVAVVGAIPSSVLIYVSIYYDCFPRTAVQITYVLAIAVGSTIALHFEALRLLVRSRRLENVGWIVGIEKCRLLIQQLYQYLG